MRKILKCKKCGSKNVVRDGFCREHYNEYQREYRKNNKEKFKKYDYNDYYMKGKKIKCSECDNEFYSNAKNKYKKFCSRQCAYSSWKKNNTRKGKNNPGYRSGLYVGGKWSKSKTGATHLKMCREYRIKFLEENNYCSCELCGVSNSFKFEVHHIVFASEAPKHKELHNFSNMIMLCIKCHNRMHSEKKLRDKLVEERNLEKLFNRKLIYDRSSNKTVKCK